MTVSDMPNALILGGTGFVGRHLVTYLVENRLCNVVRVVDKVLPNTAYLTARQQRAFEQCEFKQGNLASQASVEKVFAHHQDPNFRWDWVINLAAETKYSQAEEVYQQKVYQVTVQCARHAANVGARVFVEMSTAQVYDADKKPSNEGGKIKPWTNIAKYKLRAEEELASIPGLNYVIVRPAIIYGVGDTSGITPRLIVAAVYKELREEMKFLWTKDLRINTVHVEDVAKALVVLAEAGAQKSLVPGSIWNLADRGDTDQEKVNAILRTIFGISTGYQGTIISNLARLNLKEVTEDVNEKHLQPWFDICKRYGIINSPLTPYLDQELLYNNSLAVDGSKIERELSFRYSVPEITEQSLREVIAGFIEVGIFPENFV